MLEDTGKVGRIGHVSNVDKALPDGVNHYNDLFTSYRGGSTLGIKIYKFLAQDV